jgi:hypothetical protein
MPSIAATSREYGNDAGRDDRRGLDAREQRAVHLSQPRSCLRIRRQFAHEPIVETQ